MIYAVNKRTKEHRVVKSNADVCEKEWYRSSGWALVGADPDGWIEWRGGQCPLPDLDPVEVKMRDGDIDIDSNGYAMDWHHENECWDIIAYRPVLKDPEEDD